MCFVAENLLYLSNGITEYSMSVMVSVVAISNHSSNIQADQLYLCVKMFYAGEVPVLSVANVAGLRHHRKHVRTPVALVCPLGIGMNSLTPPAMG